jgi:hypothetical protein
VKREGRDTARGHHGLGGVRQAVAAIQRLPYVAMQHTVRTVGLASRRGHILGSRVQCAADRLIRFLLWRR